MNIKQSLKKFQTLTVMTVIAASAAMGQISTNKKPTVISIHEAIEKNMLELKINGLYEPFRFEEIIDKNGMHYGKCMALYSKSNIDSFVLIKLDCGTELIPTDTLFQTMIVTKSVEFPLYPYETFNTLIYAMCGELHDNPPFVKSSYKIGALADSNTVKLAQYFEKRYIQNMIGQHALWAYTDKASFKELEKYGADSASIALTASILEELAIETPITPKKQGKDPKSNISILEESLKASKTVLFFKLAVIAIIIITVIFWTLKKKSNKLN
jgi:hypothetical protein